jgi:cell division protein ZipA
MDATTLRIVLLILGALFLAGIYLYETKRRKRESAQARRRREAVMDRAHVDSAAHGTGPADEADNHESADEPMLASGESEETWINWEEEDTELLEKEFSEIGQVDLDDDTAAGLELSAESEPVTSEPQQQDLFGFSAQEESPVDVPKLIIQINLRARSRPFSGPDIEKAMRDTGLAMGELAIYQRFATDGSLKVLFNVASMVEPGVFPRQDVENFTTPGLTLFTQLPGPGDSMAIFSDMLFTAERLAATLDGELQDETHSALSKQTIEHLRGKIMEHRRQVQLARSKG